jgi:hypothetical protein
VVAQRTSGYRKPTLKAPLFPAPNSVDPERHRMVAIAAGTDTYGRVKKISGTPIVTKFAMLQFLPLYPLESFYLVGAGPIETTGIPFFASLHTVSINGIPLASVDKTSVVVAYARGLFGALAIIGFLVIVPGIMYLTGEHLDDIAMYGMRGLLISLFTGIVGGMLTYAIPLTPRREYDIRRYSEKVLGFAIDAALLRPDTSASLLEYLGERYEIEPNSPLQWIHHLIAARANIAQKSNMHRMEAQTDELLEKLRHAERIGDFQTM